jgi:hypothetical protein
MGLGFDVASYQLSAQPQSHSNEVLNKYKYRQDLKKLLFLRNKEGAAIECPKSI